MASGPHIVVEVNAGPILCAVHRLLAAVGAACEAHPDIADAMGERAWTLVEQIKRQRLFESAMKRSNLN